MTPDAPKKWLPTPEQALYDTYGGWIMAEYKTGIDSRAKASGELITCDNGNLYILTNMGVVIIPDADVVSASFFMYRNYGGELMVWTLGGTLSTLSHGYSFLISAPLWFIAGTITAANESRNGVLVLQGRPFSYTEIRKYARFPQGLPEGIELSELKFKPVN